ncbi:protein kinase [Streptomyces lydicus]|nr:protein kinase [Streptomyces lydicus]
MGVVCRAVDEVLGREVAVKVLRAYTDASAPELADLRTRMQREARAAARIRHSGVVTVHDVIDEDGRPVIVMELVDGPSLDDALEQRGALDPRETARIGAQVMDALDAAHQAGVLHRDVKPGNVLLEGWGDHPGRQGPGAGRVVLTDFGIASIEAPGDGATTHLTRSGELVGSLDYLPPERAQGQDPTRASDIWSLGMTLYAAVEGGGAPFRRTSVWSTLTAIVTEALPEPQRAGPLTPVLYALMAKNPADRPSAAQARSLLQAVAEGREPVLPPAPGAPHPLTATDVRAVAPPPSPQGPARRPVPAAGSGRRRRAPASWLGARRRPGQRTGSAGRRPGAAPAASPPATRSRTPAPPRSPRFPLRITRFPRHIRRLPAPSPRRPRASRTRLPGPRTTRPVWWPVRPSVPPGRTRPGRRLRRWGHRAAARPWAAPGRARRGGGAGRARRRRRGDLRAGRRGPSKTVADGGRRSAAPAGTPGGPVHRAPTAARTRARGRATARSGRRRGAVRARPGERAPGRTPGRPPRAARRTVERPRTPSPVPRAGVQVGRATEGRAARTTAAARAVRTAPPAGPEAAGRAAAAAIRRRPPRRACPSAAARPTATSGAPRTPTPRRSSRPAI